MSLWGRSCGAIDLFSAPQLAGCGQRGHWGLEVQTTPRARVNPIDSAERAELAAVCARARRRILKMIHAAGSGHPGGSFSAIDIITVLYQRYLRFRPREPQWPDRDRFVLSKGHGAPALYAALFEAGYYDDEEVLQSLRRYGSPLQGHPVMGKLPGVEMTTGSLGQGFSAAVGMALGVRLDGRQSRIFSLLGDGECDEGIIWEATMAAAHYKLDNLVAVVDHNRFQIDGPNVQIMDLGDLAAKFSAFGWATTEIDGHDLDQICDAFECGIAVQGQPAMIIAHTKKGHGVSFMDDNNRFHGIAPSDAELTAALKELGEQP